MNNLTLNKGCLALAAALICAAPAMASSKTTTTTTTTTTKITPCPGIVLSNGCRAVQEETVIYGCPVTSLVAPDVVVSKIVLYRPDDLITRRNDLLGKVALERLDGTLTASQAGNLNDRIMRLDDRRKGLVRDNSVAYYKSVKRLYSDYDRIDKDMKHESGEGAKQLAGRYAVVTY